MKFKAYFVAIGLLCFVALSTVIYNSCIVQTPMQEFNLSQLPKLQVGDFVLRMGTSKESFLISLLSDSEYSHIGMVVSVKPIMIIHASTDELKPIENQVFLSSINEFLSSKLSSKFLILRPDFLHKTQKDAIVRLLQNRIGEPFVLTSSKEKNLYCTTLLEQTINTVYPFRPKYKYIQSPFFEGYYLFPQAFLDYNQTTIIYKAKIDKN